VADVFDALTTRRPYKEAMPLEAARQYLEEKKGREFDPACVDAFLSRWDEVAAIARPKSSSAAPKTEIIAPPMAAVEQPADHPGRKLMAPV
jgi:putative two-component system response regulator